jgi:hypothetical protein
MRVYLWKQNKKPKAMTNFTLKFGKYKGQQFASTPKSYQDWLLAQDWFKKPETNEAKYDVVRKFSADYRMGMGRSKEIMIYNLTWDEANQHKDCMNMYQLDDCTECFYIESSRY